MQRRVVGRPYRTRRRGKVQVLEDEKGHKWIVCSGCRMDRHAAGFGSVDAMARQHADTCDR